MTASVRFSHLRAYGRSALHGWHARNAPEAPPNAAMQLGTAVHAMVFGNRQVVSYPGKQRRGKEYDAFAADNAGAEILTLAEYSKARHMADAVLASKVAAPYLRGITEETILFRWNGLDCRATPDIRGGDFLTELKTSATSDPARFPFHAIRMAYHAQMRMQQLACPGHHDCFVICCESTAPYPVTVFRIDERALDAGERMLILWSERLKMCESSGTFPAYAECVMPIDIPEDESGFEFNDEPLAETTE